ncbi:hypothetical protein, partial [Klebsiella variicola]|uniref:hypothetical protein n=1 Tax=Klebsiella variicola TaxID=244366 RepID=UPI00195471BC
GLQGVGSSAATLSASWTLAADIAAAGTGGWNGGAGFKPIGDGVTGFSGSLDGAGHVVSGLVINRPGAD